MRARSRTFEWNDGVTVSVNDQRRLGDEPDALLAGSAPPEQDIFRLDRPIIRPS